MATSLPPVGAEIDAPAAPSAPPPVGAEIEAPVPAATPPAPAPAGPPAEVLDLRAQFEAPVGRMRAFRRRPANANLDEYLSPQEQRDWGAVQLGGDEERRAAYLRWQARHTELTREDAAAAVRIAAAKQLPVDLVLKDLPTYRKQLEVERVDWDELATAHPVLADFLLSDPARLHLVKDRAADFKGLDAILGRWAPVTARQAAAEEGKSAEEQIRLETQLQADPDAVVRSWTRPVWMDWTRRVWTQDLPLQMAHNAAALSAAMRADLSKVENHTVEERQASWEQQGWGKRNFGLSDTKGLSPAEFWERYSGADQVTLQRDLTPDERATLADMQAAELRAQLAALPPMLADPARRDQLVQRLAAAEQRSHGGLHAETRRAIEDLEAEASPSRDYGRFSRTLAGQIVYAPVKMQRVLAGNAAAAPAGLPGVFAYNFLDQWGPLAYELQQTKGPDGEAIDPMRAALLATAGAGVSSAIQSVPLGRISGRLAGTLVEDATARAATRLLVQREAKDILWHAAKEGGTDYVAGIAAMAAGQMAVSSSREAARMSVDPKHELDHDQVLRDGLDALKAAATDLLIPTVAGSGRSVWAELGRARAAQKSAVDIQELREQGAKLEDVVAAAPEEALRLMQAMVRDAGEGAAVTDTVHVDIEAFQRHFQGQKMDPRAVAAEILGDGGKAYDRAVAQRSPRLAIPTPDFIVKLGTGELAKHGEALLPDMATGADVATPREAAALAKRAAERMAELRKLEPSKMELDQARVFEAFREQALAAGEPEKVATANAQLYSAALKVMAERAGRGETAWDLYQLHPLRIMRGEGVPELAAAAQGARLEQAERVAPPPPLDPERDVVISPVPADRLAELDTLPRDARGGLHKTALFQWAVKRLVGNYTNAATGWEIGVGRAGLGETINRSGPITKRVVAALPELLREAVFAYGEPHKTTDRNISKVHVLYGAVSDGGALRRVEIKVKETNAGQRFYHLMAVEMESPVSSGSSASGRETAGGSEQTPGSIKVRSLLEGVKRRDGSPVLPSEGEGGGRLRQGRLGEVEGRPVTLQREGDRGYINIFPKSPKEGESVRLDVHLLASDRSTLAHESFHGLSVLLGQVATRADAPAELRADYQRLLEAMGYKDHGERQSAPRAAAEERGSHLWEMYLAEGKAPSAELLPAFARFKAWLTRIYRGVLGIRGQYKKEFGKDLELSDDVRELFGRLLAGDEATRDAARDVQVELPAVQLTPEEEAQSAQLLAEARTRAELELQRQMVAEEAQSDREFMREARHQVETETKSRLEETDPVYRAQAALDRGELHGLPVKLAIDPEAVRAELGAEVLAELPKKYFDAEQGIPPDVAAHILGFESGAEMLRQLANAEPAAARLRREVSARMADLYPRLQDRPALLREMASDALQNDALLRDGMLRLRALEREAGLPPTRSDLGAVKAAAREAVSEKTIAELRPGLYQAQARALARKASELTKPEARRDAFEAYLFNQAMAQAAREARAEGEKIARALQRYTTEASRGKLGKVVETGPDGKLAQPYLEQRDALLAAFEFRASVTGKETRSREAQRTALEAWAKERWADGDSVIIPPKILEALTRATHWKDLTVAELRDLKAAADSITQQAELRNTYRVGEQRVATEQVTTELQAAAVKNGARLSDDRIRTLRDRAAERAREGKHALEYLELVFDELDGFDPDGPWKKYVWQPLSDASYRYYDLVRETTAKVQKRLEALTMADRQRIKRVKFEVDGRQYTLENAIAVLLNCGNESNESKTVRGMSDPRIAEAFNRTPWFGRGSRDKILAQLEQRDADLVTDIWKMLDSLRPHMEVLEKQDTGIAPTWVQAKKFTFTGKDGKQITVDGGYYPMLYERKTRIGKTQGEAEAAAANGMPGLFAPGYDRVITPGGHLESRVESFARPVDLTLDRLPAKLTASAKDIAFRLPGKQAYRVLMDERIVGALTQALGDKGHDLVLGWLRDAVNDVMLPDVGAGPVLSFMSWAKGQTYKAMFPFNVGQAAQNLADAVGVQAVVPRRYAMAAALKLARDIPGARQRILAESPEMRLRADGYGRIAQELRSVFKRSELGLLWDHVSEVGMIPFETTNGMMEYSVYQGAKDHALAQGKTEAEAIEHAQDMVRRAFGGKRTIDLTPIQRDRVVRHFTMFWGWAGANLNLWIRARSQAGVEWSNGRKLKALATLGGTFAAISAKMLASEVLTGKGPKDDDEDGKVDAGDVARWAAFRSVTAVPSLLPMVGSGVRQLAGGETSRDLSLTPWTNLLNASFKALSATQRAAAAEEELEDDQEVELFLAWLEAGGALTGAPVTQARATTRYWLKRPEGATTATDVLGTAFGPDREGKLSHLTVNE